MAAKQHSEGSSFSSGGKWSGWVAEVSLLTWGDLQDGMLHIELGDRLPTGRELMLARRTISILWLNVEGLQPATEGDPPTLV